MTDQTRTGTYGSWYSYYLCEFSGKIELPPELEGIPGIKQLTRELSSIRFHSTAPRCQCMRRYTDAQILRLGAITLVVMLLVMAASFNLSKFPGFGGSTSTAPSSPTPAACAAATWCRSAASGSAGSQEVELDGDQGAGDLRGRQRRRVRRREPGLDRGAQPARREVPRADPGRLAASSTRTTRSRSSRTESAYDIVGVFGDLTTTTERIDTGQLKQALDVVSDTMNASAPAGPRQPSRASPGSPQTVASRDAEIQSLLESSRSVSALLADRSDDIVRLMDRSDLVFQELAARKEAIHRLLVNARILADELRGLARGQPGSRSARRCSEVDDAARRC